MESVESVVAKLLAEKQTIDEVGVQILQLAAQLERCQQNIVGIVTERPARPADVIAPSVGNMAGQLLASIEFGTVAVDAMNEYILNIRG